MSNIDIPIYKPYFTGKEKEYVLECLDTGWISSKGRFVSKFEQTFSEFIGGGYSASCANGTVALHLALMAVDIKPEDEVLVPSFTYVASVNVIMFCNARPVFLDSDPKTLQINIDDIKHNINSKTKAIIVPHLYGMMTEMDRLMDIATKYNLKVIEDCAESFGSYYNSKHSGTFGDIATFSFFGNKTITTGEGGMVFSNHQHLIHKVNHLKSQGLASLNYFSADKREYWHDEIGYNYRMTNIAAAIGLAQIESAHYIIHRKRCIADTYYRFLNKEKITVLRPIPNAESSYWMVTILFQSEKIKNHVRQILETKGVETRPIFPLVNTMPMYQDVKFKSLVGANTFANLGINVPSYPDIQENQILYIVNIINEEIK